MSLLTKKEFAQAIGIHEKHLPTYYEERKKFVYVDVATGKLARIDTNNPINAAFILERAQKLIKEGKEVVINGIPVISLSKTELSPKFEAIRPEKVQTAAKSNKTVILPIDQPKQPFYQQLPNTIPDFDVNEPITLAKSTLKANKQDITINIANANSNKNEINTDFYKLDQQLEQQQLEKTFEETEILRLKKDKTSGMVVPTAAIIPLFTAQNSELMNSLRIGLEDFILEIGTLASLTNDQITEYRAKVLDSVNIAGETALDSGIQKIDLIIQTYSTARGAGEKR